MPDSFYSARAAEDVRRLGYAAGDFRRARGRWPTHAELRAVDPNLPRRDRWRHEFRFETQADRLIVSCAGVDGLFGTCDDVACHPISPDW